MIGTGAQNGEARSGPVPGTDAGSDVAERRRRAPRGAGDLLREQIVDAATELLLTGGDAKGVSMRSVAQRAGVTPPSIYLHFADKDALLDAVCARYFVHLDEEMQRTAAEYEATVDRMWAQGMAYVRFAVANPLMYRIAVMGEPRPGSDVDLALGSAAFAHLRESVVRLHDEGVLVGGDVDRTSLEMMTVAHGVAALLISRPYLPFGDVEEFTSSVLWSACCGRVALDRIGRHGSPQEAVGRLRERLDD